MDGTKLNRRQLRRIIREEKQRLLNEMTPADMGMAAARMDDQRRDEINTNIEVPVELFDEIVEFLERMNAHQLLLKLERETGIL